ncbi:MAG TPA: ATPase domain-containing protein, partial [Chloroflexaceae bacterium]|nr:ATPase domain-containing protein [Chloroflexaceae bacterium]
PGEHNPALLAERLLGGLDRLGARRLVIDTLSGFSAGAIYPERIGTFLAALLNELRARDVTTLITMETPRVLDPIEDTSRLGISALVDNILFLRYAEDAARLRREITVIKLRRSGFDPVARELTIGARGLVVGAAARGEHGGEPVAGRTSPARSRRRRGHDL